MSQSIRKQILCALFAAAMAICAQLSIPVGLVPISMGSLAVLLAGGVLGKKYGTLSMVLYILLGAIGLPVFAMGKGGFSVLAGPTGGYIIGYVFMAFITGWFAEKYPQRKGMLLVGMVTGNLICLLYTSQRQRHFPTLRFRNSRMKTWCAWKTRPGRNGRMETG